MAKIIILTGAGVSAESGISTFRDKDGLWEDYKIEEVCYFDSLKKHKNKTISFYDQRRAELNDKYPNYAHKIIAELKNKYFNEIAVVTQNVDDLFEKAGIDFNNIIHLHGFLKHLRCVNDKCSLLFDVGYSAQKNAKCLECDSDLRPNIVFFKEPIPQYDFFNKEIENCEMLIIIGTSGRVIPLNNLAKHVGNSILCNAGPSKYIDEKCFGKIFYKKATEAINEIKKEIELFLNNRN